MSKLGKLFLFLAFILLAIGMAIKGYFAVDRPWVNWMPLSCFGGFILAAVINDFTFFKEFFSLRTTKHGMNMGTLILLVFITLAAINYVAISRNKKWDLTDEKLNSLSPQTIQVVKSLKSDLTLRGFFVDNAEEEMKKKAQFQFLSNLLEYENKSVKTEIWDPQKRPDLAKQYGVEFSGTVVLSYNGKQNAITELGEQDLINAIVKITRDKNKVFYFITGHGELDIASAEPTGGASFKKALEDSSYEVKVLNMVEQPKFPEDADAVAILGPKRELLEVEKKNILEYVRKGGKVLLAADPGFKHNMAQIMSALGVIFDGSYIIDQVGGMVARNVHLAIGTNYSKTSEITKSFSNGMTAFQLASPLEKSDKSTFAFDEFVKSSPASYTKKQLSEGEKFDEKTDKKGPFVLGIKVSGKMTEDKDAKEFTAVMFGDSDFFNNQLLNVQLNRDLALNSAAALAKDSELISIRPKQRSGTNLMMSENQFDLLKWAMFVPFPLLFFAMSGVLWFKRRHA